MSTLTDRVFNTAHLSDTTTLYLLNRAMETYGYLPLDSFTAADMAFLETYMHIDREKSRVYKRDQWSIEYKRRQEIQAQAAEERSKWHLSRETGISFEVVNMLQQNAEARAMLLELQAKIAEMSKK